MNDKELLYITITLAILVIISQLFFCKKLLFITLKITLITVVFLSIFQRKPTDVQAQLTMFKDKCKKIYQESKEPKDNRSVRQSCIGEVEVNLF